jgi:N-hydroxyarylamine O-acetyltransferase
VPCEEPGPGPPSCPALPWAYDAPLVYLDLVPLQDLDAYLRRLGLDDTAGLAEIHRAHATTIPFENFDPLSGRPVALDLDRLEEKMVANRRGGYCFEHNLLLQAALQSLGYEVVPMLARVRMGASDGPPGPLNHLLLKVVHEGTPWLADVGLGGGGLLDPLPFATGEETDQSGWRYRLVPDGEELVLQVFRDGGWFDFYGFVPKEAVFADIEVGNWYTSTSPNSGFTTGVFAGARRVDRCLSLFASDRATVVERPVGGASTTTEVPMDEVPGILEARFGLPGVHRDEAGRFRITEPTP